MRATLASPVPVVTVVPLRALARGGALLLSLIILASLLAVLRHERRYKGRIYPGVAMAGVSLGGLEPAAALQLLENQTLPDAEAVELRALGRSWHLSREDLGAHLDVRSAAQSAFQFGRSGQRSQALASMLAARWRGAELAPPVAVDVRTAQGTLSRLASEFEKKPTNATLVIEGTQVRADPAQPGIALDRHGAVALVAEYLTRQHTGGLDLPITYPEPHVVSAREAAHRARTFLASDLVVRHGQRTWHLQPAGLAGMLRIGEEPAGDGQARLTVEIDQQQLANFVQQIGAEIDEPGRNPRFDFDPTTGQLALLRPGEAGFIVDVPAMTQTLADAAETEQREIELRMSDQTALIANDATADALGIKELIWSETSYYNGSAAGRIRNIQIAASKFHGLIIPPDGVFSFAEHIGPITAAEGYEETIIIKDNRSARGTGGGVCQVSTTVFRAAFWAGLPITERWAHSYRVPYYEQGAKPIGLDATVYVPQVDLKFKNDTGAHLLIETSSNPAKRTVTFSFYGTKPDRRVELIGPSVSNRRSPAGPLYQEDPSKPIGYTENVELARDGMDINLTRVVYREDSQVLHDSFFSRYHPTRLTYVIGTGGAAVDGD